MFWRITYISTARCHDLDRDLVAILDEARNHNARNAITGVLLYAGGSFYQTLEGHRSDVVYIFNRIKRDRRHDGVIQLENETSRLRTFAAWSMAHRDLPPDHEIARRIAQIASGDKPAFRTNFAAQKMDILITSFLTV